MTTIVMVLAVLLFFSIAVFGEDLIKFSDNLFEPDSNVTSKDQFYKFYIYEFWKRSFDFTGKTKRKEYWIAFLFYSLTSIILVITGLILSSINANLLLILPLIHAITSIIPSFSIQIRRLRDIGKEPEWILLTLIPFASLVLFFWYTRPSHSKTGDKLNSSSYQIEEQDSNQSVKDSERKVKPSFMSDSGRNNINKKMDEIEIQLDRSKSMHNQGLITEDEYKSMRKKTLRL